MRTIWKYVLEATDEQVVRLPAGAKILSVQSQHVDICLWAEVETDKPLEARTVLIYGTGHPVVEHVRRVHLGTFQLHDGALVFHAFEATK